MNVSPTGIIAEVSPGQLTVPDAATPMANVLVPAEAEVRELLGIPEGIALAGHVATGHRADPWPSRLARNPVADFTFGERYGAPWR